MLNKTFTYPWFKNYTTAYQTYTKENKAIIIINSFGWNDGISDLIQSQLITQINPKLEIELSGIDFDDPTALESNTTDEAIKILKSYEFNKGK